MKLFDAGATVVAIIFIALIAAAATDKHATGGKHLKATGKAIDGVMCPISKACP